MNAPASKTAILFCHGILGHPRHFDFLLPEVPGDWTVCNLLLPGHGGSVKDFGQSSLEQWTDCYRAALDRLLETHDRVFLCGHSMGTLFALQAAASRGTICGLFLLAVPMGAAPRPISLWNCLKYALGLIREDDERAMALKHAASIPPEIKLWRYIPWIPRFLELFRLIHSTKKMLPQVKLPGLAFQSAHDELVSHKAPQRLAAAPGLQVEILPDSYHFYLTDKDRETVIKAFRHWIAHHEFNS
ncbi:MAG: alpha/beta fold hydrolase [Clostridiales bacterium]|nr:alpha/beta fold hydrolase [Clostridiales bacterium]